jgi:hypothetical protein
MCDRSKPSKPASQPATQPAPLLLIVSTKLNVKNIFSFLEKHFIPEKYRCIINIAYAFANFLSTNILFL